jgi:hypothetical protein
MKTEIFENSIQFFKKSKFRFFNLLKNDEKSYNKEINIDIECSHGGD